MKKTLLLLSCSALLFITAPSCKKCTHCIEKDSSGNTQYDYGEACGKKTEIENFETQSKALVDPGNTVECTRD